MLISPVGDESSRMLKNTLSTAKNGSHTSSDRIFSPSKVSAQVLNQKVSSLLSDICDGLGLGGSTNDLGTNLAAICGFAQLPQQAEALHPSRALRYPSPIRHC